MSQSNDVQKLDKILDMFELYVADNEDEFADDMKADKATVKEALEHLLEQSNREARTELRKIWNKPGRNPEYHYNQQERLRREWPMLYNWIMKELQHPEGREDE